MTIDISVVLNVILVLILIYVYGRLCMDYGESKNRKDNLKAYYYGNKDMLDFLSKNKVITLEDDGGISPGTNNWKPSMQDLKAAKNGAEKLMKLF